ncbi:MAG: UxaA family hydrolase, partial [Gemmatimonadaceae bacterium]|nr:UxaA family hydrolase [Gemmatimonadaceae bacterium]
MAPAAPPAAIRVHPSDDVAVAVRALAAGETIVVDQVEVRVATDIPAGHKVALRAIGAGEAVTKYGVPIGVATAPIAA